MKLHHNFGILLTFFILKFFGLLPFSIDLNTFEISFSVKSIIWCISFNGALLLIDPYIESVAYMFGNPYGITFSVSTISSKGTYLMILFCVCWSIFNIKLIFKIIKLVQTAFEKLQQFDADLLEIDKLVIKNISNFIIPQIASLLTYVVYFHCILKNGKVVLAPLANIKHMFGSLVLVKYDIFLIFLKIGFSKINQIIKSLNNPEDGYVIDELSEIYSKLCEASILISKKFSIPILLFLGYVFIVIDSKCLEIFRNLAYGMDDGILTSVCKTVWLFAKLSEFVIILMDGNSVIQKV